MSMHEFSKNCIEKNIVFIFILLCFHENLINICYLSNYEDFCFKFGHTL